MDLNKVLDGTGLKKLLEKIDSIYARKKDINKKPELVESENKKSIAPFQYAFSDCTNIPNNNDCLYIGKGAFYNCDKITDIANHSVLYTDSYAFQQNLNLKEISLISCKYIGNKTFYGCNNLTSIRLPNCIEIGDDAFSYCDHLSSVDLKNVKTIGKRAFSYYINWEWRRSLGKGYITDYINVDNFNLDFPRCETIGAEAFKYCHLTSIHIPNCQFIGDFAFERCILLKEIVVNENCIFSNDTFTRMEPNSADLHIRNYHYTIYNQDRSKVYDKDAKKWVQNQSQ